MSSPPLLTSGARSRAQAPSGAVPLAHLHPAVLPAHQLHGFAAGQTDLCLPQCSDDLLRSVSLPSHPDLLAEKLQTSSILTLHLVSFQGVRSGEPELLLDLDTVNVVRPHLLPNGKAVLFGTGGTAQTSRIFIFEIETGYVRELVPAGNHPRYVATGHLIYGHAEGALMGVPFDLETLQTTGSPVTLLPELSVYSAGASQFAVSETGTLIYDVSSGACQRQ